LRATPIAEAMVALTLMDHYLRDRAQNADVARKARADQSGTGQPGTDQSGTDQSGTPKASTK
jgi:hypothetical protein